jgi:hypothetical protein
LSGSREAGPEVPAPASAEAVAAAAAFLRDHPARIRAVARGLKGSERSLDSVVSGHSMGSQLPDGAPIRIQLCQRDVYEPGEVVAFLTDRQVAVHRVHFCGRRGRRRGMLITRGDAHLYPDLPIHVSSVLGTVVAVRTERGWCPPAVPPLRPLPQRALARVWLTVASALCLTDLDFARRSLGFLFFCGRSALTLASDVTRRLAPRSRSRAS